MRLAVCEALRDEGFVAVEAANVEEALAVLEVGLGIDLVFTDVRMPGAVDGLQFARRLKQERPFLPVVVTSGHLERVALAWVSGFLPKPYLPDQLIAMIGTLLPKEEGE
ncbi:response regulator receiver domain-containing protein [Aquabacter spiritensis]|uniref:Response regulator receiver domain-containing protein n=1 Tax=Aquabacter spiritensis TaxID=933073 RepID=A0A4R3LZR8_9HYPH|nr:response regulator receiver domain-containing protein [Aquabacter spiritensis]